MIGLEQNRYGKRAVRLLRVVRNPGVHDVTEWEVDVLVEGDFAGSYLSDDNSSVVPTDTMKNVILALAYDLPETSRDAFALAVAECLLSRYQHLSACEVELREKLWKRMAPGGRPHPHCFLRDSNGKPFTAVHAARGEPVRHSAGIREFVVMKTTESGFAGFARCELTTLPETTDRILATSLDARWEYLPGATANGAALLDLMLEIFATTYSPSVQRTLYQMGEAALRAFPGIARIKLTMPNKHYLNIDLSCLGRPAAQKTIFLPTDDPYGTIEAVVARHDLTSL